VIARLETQSQDGHSNKEFSMKNVFRWIGIIAIATVIGFSFISCEEEKEEEKDVLDGTTWKATTTEDGVTMNIVLTFSSPNFTYTMTGGGQSDTQNGTYSVSGSTVTMTIDGQSQTGTLSGNTLTVLGITFTKQ
jgi:hypothetical protein